MNGAPPDGFFPVVYDELKRLAAARLVHERVGLSLEIIAIPDASPGRGRGCRAADLDMAAHRRTALERFTGPLGAKDGRLTRPMA
jgi:hypothetical protein